MTYRGSIVNMVDCGNLRCFQERRLIKKDLMSWSKKIPLVVGLETIAEHVGSRRKVRKLFEPFHSLESKTPQDWEPEENCFYCSDRIQLLFDAIEKTDSKEGGKILKDHPSLRHLGEVLPFLPQFYTSDFGRDLLTDIKSASTEPEPSSPEKEPEPEPKANIELKVPAVSSPGPSAKLKKASPPNSRKCHLDEDLSSSMSEVKGATLTGRRGGSMYGVPRRTLRTKMFKMETDESRVTAATLLDDDSHSSTDISHNAPASELALFKHLPRYGEIHDRPLMLTDLLQLSSLQYLTPIAMPYFITPEMISMHYGNMEEETEWERRLQALRHKHNISQASMNHYKAKAAAHRFKPYQHDLIKRLTHERLQQEIRAIRTRRRDECTASNEVPAARPSAKSRSGRVCDGRDRHVSDHHHHHQAPPQAKRVKRELKESSVMNSSGLLQDALYKALNTSHPFLNSLHESNSSDSDAGNKVPDYIYQSLPSIGEKRGPALSKDSDMERRIYEGLLKYDNTRIGDTLKDIIVKTISEKVKCKLESTDFAGLVGSATNEEKQKAKESILSAFSVPDVCASSPPKRSRRESHHGSQGKSSSTSASVTSSHNSSSGGTQAKKTRPKRGQYRKYNSQLLTEAVKAVQRGEMSVHRAGSYYGVPHSTLEYKVKERHLLRQKKIKEQQEAKQKQEAEAAKRKEDEENSNSQGSLDEEELSPDKRMSSRESSNSSPPKSGQSTSPWLPAMSGGLPYENAAALGLFGVGFGISTPASELLRKLQHKVQS
ncbi:mushroom body large-type Kenyon cell-specific protein 1-like [Dreissena polymorpha]|nr:mushroom body large-type Kenyon cell-specific protein 1-like [Dreissena polymorpha]